MRIHRIIVPTFALLLTTACGVITKSSDEGQNTQSGLSGLSNVTAMPCAMAGGTCKAANECGVGGGTIGGSDYNCGGSRRVCCLPTCGRDVETFECCNESHTYAPRPVCQGGKLTCAAGQTQVPIGTCLGKHTP